MGRFTAAAVWGEFWFCHYSAGRRVMKEDFFIDGGRMSDGLYLKPRECVSVGWHFPVSIGKRGQGFGDNQCILLTQKKNKTANSYAVQRESVEP